MNGELSISLSLSYFQCLLHVLRWRHIFAWINSYLSIINQRRSKKSRSRVFFLFSVSKKKFKLKLAYDQRWSTYLNVSFFRSSVIFFILSSIRSLFNTLLLWCVASHGISIDHDQTWRFRLILIPYHGVSLCSRVSLKSGHHRCAKIYLFIYQIVGFGLQAALLLVYSILRLT